MSKAAIGVSSGMTLFRRAGCTIKWKRLSAGAAPHRRRNSYLDFPGDASRWASPVMGTKVTGNTFFRS
jgi:hypothetical protein